MKVKTIGLAAFAALALGLGLVFGAGAAPPPNCSSSCQSACGARYNSCLAAGGSQATCLSRFSSCLSACRCPLP
jgi:hypothetical protein